MRGFHQRRKRDPGAALDDKNRDSAKNYDPPDYFPLSPLHWTAITAIAKPFEVNLR
jgi:hypothetical protein